MNEINHPHQWFGGRSYAQHGDDFAILNIFKRLHIEQPSYMDIGAHHPWELSNTALLYQRGSVGINVDANEDVIPLFNQERPRDVNVWAAILHPLNVIKLGGSVPLYRMSETSGINTTVESGLAGHGGARSTVVVPAKSISVILETWSADHRWPDLLSIDAEGRDFEILESIHWEEERNKLPKVICVEAVSPAGDFTMALRELMHSVGYYAHSWCGSNILFTPIKLKHMLH